MPEVIVAVSAIVFLLGLLARLNSNKYKLRVEKYLKLSPKDRQQLFEQVKETHQIKFDRFFQEYFWFMVTARGEVVDAGMGDTTPNALMLAVESIQRDEVVFLATRGDEYHVPEFPEYQGFMFFCKLMGCLKSKLSLLHLEWEDGGISACFETINNSVSSNAIHLYLDANEVCWHIPALDEEHQSLPNQELEEYSPRLLARRIVRELHQLQEVENA